MDKTKNRQKPNTWGTTGQSGVQTVQISSAENFRKPKHVLTKWSPRPKPKLCLRSSNIAMRIGWVARSCYRKSEAILLHTRVFGSGWHVMNHDRRKQYFLTTYVMWCYVYVCLLYILSIIWLYIYIIIILHIIYVYPYIYIYIDCIYIYIYIWSVVNIYCRGDMWVNQNLQNNTIQYTLILNIAHFFPSDVCGSK